MAKHMIILERGNKIVHRVKGSGMVVLDQKRLEWVIVDFGNGPERIRIKEDDLIMVY